MRDFSPFFQICHVKTMTNQPEPVLLAEQIAFWADKLRDLSSAGLEYGKDRKPTNLKSMGSFVGF
jgi:hypothetical protein